MDQGQCPFGRKVLTLTHAHLHRCEESKPHKDNRYQERAKLAESQLADMSQRMLTATLLVRSRTNDQ